MADHRADDIISAVLTAVTGLATTGANAFRGRTYELPESSLPCVCVYQGGDFPLTNTSPWTFIDSELSIVVEAIVKDSSAQAETTLNQIRYEVSEALQGDVTLGLSFVMNTTEGSATITLDGSTNEIVGRMRMEWVVLYRRLRTILPPVPSGASISTDGYTLTISFSVPVVSGTPALGFTIAGTTVDSAVISGGNIVITLPMQLIGASVGDVSYDDTVGNIAGAGGDVASFGSLSVTNNSTATGSWSSLGSTSVSNTAPSIAALNSTDIVFADRDNDALRLYRWGGSSWSLIGTPLSVAMTQPGVVALNSTDFAWIDSSANELRTYRWDGSDFAQVGSSFTGLSLLASPQGLARLSATRIAHVNGNGDTLQAYDWNGSTWSTVGSGFGVGAAGNCSITALNSTDIVFIDSSADALKLYRFNGSTWSQIGSSFAIANISAPVVEAINGTDVAFYDVNIDSLRTYRWNGSVFAQIGSSLTVSSSGGRPWLTNMGTNRVAFVDDSIDQIRLYQWA